MKNIFFIILLIIPCTVKTQSFNYNFKDATLRIDYLHSGNHEEEEYKLVEFVEEPHWGGSETVLKDPFDYGNYKVEMHNLATGELLYSRGYSTLFREWQATDEAKTKSRSFYEAVCMPMPRDAVKIEFHSRNKNLDWIKQFSAHYNPDKTQTVKHKNNKYRKFKVHKSGKSNEKLDIVIIPEGYTRKDRRKFKDDCNRFKDYLLESSPFNLNKDHINIWGVYSWSEETGTDIPGEDIYKNTVLNSNFYTFGSERYLTTEDYKTVKDIASNAPYDQILILVNHIKYGGGGIYNFYSIATSDNEKSDFLFEHEFGHAFAGLGDEYYTSEVAVEDFYPLDKEPWEPNITTLVKFEEKWQDMVDAETPVPTPAIPEYETTIGVYEGGGYVEKGVYRPYIDCTMKSVKYDNFCPVCQKSIQDMIDIYKK